MYKKLIKYSFVGILLGFAALQYAKTTNVIFNSKSELPNDAKSELIEDHFKYQAIFGNENSSIVIEEFSSLGCYGCKLFNQNIFPKIKEKFIDKSQVKYIITELVHGAQDYHASVLLKLAIKKYGNTEVGHDEYLKLRNYLFETQEQWMLSQNFKEVIIDIGIKYGISKEEFLNALELEDFTKEIVIGHTKRMIDKKIAVTPIVTINDEQCEDDDKIEQMIEENIKKNLG